jgi:hypothetical protein
MLAVQIDLDQLESGCASGRSTNQHGEAQMRGDGSRDSTAIKHLGLQLLEVVPVDRVNLLQPRLGCGTNTSG